MKGTISFWGGGVDGGDGTNLRIDAWKVMRWVEGDVGCVQPTAAFTNAMSGFFCRPT